jgi:antitoxin component of MazEF toxin-antitoxin module
MATRSKAQKWHGGICAPVPAAIARKLQIPGTPILVREQNGEIIVTPIRKHRRTLAEILQSCRKRFPKGNPHGEFDWGAPVGKEVW